MAFPTTLTNAVNNTTDTDADQLNNIEAKIGIDGSAVTTSLDYKINNTLIPKSLVDAKGDIITATADNTPARLPVGNNNEKLIADSSTSTGLKWATDFGSSHSMASQAIMNGNFDVWQRGTSVALADVTLAFQADRWGDYVDDNGGTLPTLTRSRGTLTAGELAGSYFYSRLTTNGAGTSLGASSNHRYLNGIEHGTRYLCGASKTVTVSFYARSSISNKKIGVYLRQNYGTGGSPTATEIINGTNWTLTSNWVKYTHTFTTNTLNGKTFGTDHNDKLSLEFCYMWGATTNDDYVGATTAETFVGAGTIDIAQVQLCSGDVALPFCPKSFNEELLNCQRYYEKSFNYTIVPAHNTGSNSGLVQYGTQANWEYHMMPPVWYKVKKRTTVAPTIWSYNSATANRITDYNNGANAYAYANIGYGETGFNIQCTATVAAGVWLCFHWSVDAEL